MTAIALLCEIIAQGGKVPAALYRDDPAFAALLRHKYLREVGIVASLVCNECDFPHAAPVVFEDGHYGYYCPDLGFVPLERTNLQAVQPELSRLIERLAQTLECKRRKASALDVQTWRIGVVETSAGEIMLYFHPRMQSEEDARGLDQALTREIRSRWRLIVTASGTLPFTGAQTVRLDDLVELETETGVLHILAQPADLVGVPRKNSGGRPSEHGATLSAIISDRMLSGAALDGVNAEAKAILADFKSRNPGSSAPSTSTIKRHLTRSRGGS